MASILNATTSSGLVTSADNSGSLQLATNNGTTAVTINTAQKVGIGTTPSGSYILEVNGNPNFNSVGGVYLTCGTYDVIKNPSGNIIAFGGVTSSQWDTTALYTGGTERMRITSDGAISAGSTTGTVGLGVWSNYGSRIIDFARYADDGAIVGFKRGGTLVGNISVTASATAYNTSSDYRLKENIVPMTGALNTVSLLKPVTYKWKVDGSNGQGFIAHELQSIVPDAVTGEKDATEVVDIKDEKGNVIGQETKPVYQGVDVSFLVATLTAAIQELKAELDATKAEVQALKGTL